MLPHVHPREDGLREGEGGSLDGLGGPITLNTARW